MGRASSATWAILTLFFICHAGCNTNAGGVSSKEEGDASATNSAGGHHGTLRRVIMLTNGDDPFWDAMRAGMQDADRDLKLASDGLRAELDKNDGTAKGQVDKLKQYAGQNDIAAVAISVTDARNVAIQEAMRALRSQGVQVITIDSDVDRSDPAKAAAVRFAYLGTDNITGGRCLGKAARGLLPEGGQYAAFVGIKSTANAQERLAGFVEAAGDKFEQVDYLGDDMDLSTAQKNVRDALDRHPDLKALVGIWAYNAHAMAQTVKDRGIREQVAIVNFDAAPKAIAHMEDGLIDAMVVQNPYQMGYDGVKLMQALVKDDQDTICQLFPSFEPDERSFTKPNGDIRITGLKVVVPDGDKRLNAAMFEGMAEFLTLSDFKAWLKKYKLTGS
jgi:ribose transport system substrate-binding protein